MKRLIALLLAAVLALSLAACGGGGDTTSDESGDTTGGESNSMTKEEMLEVAVVADEVEIGNAIYENIVNAKQAYCGKVLEVSSIISAIDEDSISLGQVGSFLTVYLPEEDIANLQLQQSITVVGITNDDIQTDIQVINGTEFEQQCLVMEQAYLVTDRYEFTGTVKSENDFVPELPKEKVDVIYLCFPNNPTGTVLSKENLKKFVDYARENKALILFDSAYEAFITEPDIPHSIYEIEGAKEVAIEFRSFSKTAGFTGVRCAFTVVPNELFGYTKSGEKVSLNKLWNRRVTTKFNGVSYIVQRGAEAVYSEEGKKEIKENIKYYLENSKIIREGLKEARYTVYGGVNSPYIWLKVPKGFTSWEFFDKLLEKANVVGTPGSGFGPSGEGYFRLTAFGTKENSIEAIKRIKELM